jgi:hypothetical protein
MATSDILGLFTTPEQYQQSQRQAQEDQAIQFANLDPMARANYGTFRAGQQLGSALGGALGGEDPQLKLISQRQQLASQLDDTNPNSYMMVAEQARRGGDPQFAMAISDAYRQLQTGAATMKKTNLEAQKVELSIQQEQNLRDELSRLPANATEEQILGVVTKYGSPDKVLAVLQASSTKAADREARASENTRLIEARAEENRIRIEARAEEKLKDIEYKKERDLQNAKSDAERAQIAADARTQSAQIAADARRDIGRLSFDLKRQKADTDAQIAKTKPLAPSLQKDENKDLELVDSLYARAESLAPAIKLLTIDPKTKKAPLELGPINNIKYMTQNAAGNSTTESRAYAQLQRAVQEATNLKTDAAKGVQTDKDVLRFANELIAAFGGNDTKTSLEALNNFYKATKKAEEATKKRIDSRRISQKVEPYYGATSGTANNPIKLD